jgi:hypothetical protein
MLKRLSTFGSALFACMLGFAVLADEPFLTFGPRGEPGTLYARSQTAFARKPNLVVFAGPDPLHDSAKLRQTGGGLFVTKAEPSPSLTGKTIELRYSPSKRDGERVEVIVEGKPFALDAYDWEIKPISSFVNSGHNGSINISFTLSEFDVTLDEAFVDTLIGLRMIQADLMPRGVTLSQKFLPRIGDKVVLGPGEETVLAQEATAERAAQTFRARVGAAQAVYTVLTDAGINFGYQQEANKIRLSGQPALFAWNLGENEEVVPDLSYNAKFSANWDVLRNANPVVVRSIVRAFRLAAFLRARKDASQLNWGAFFHDVNGIELPPLRTPNHLTNDLH